MEALRARLLELWTKLRDLPRRTQLALAAGLVVTIALGAFVFTAATEERYAVLFSGLAEQDAAEVVEALREQRVPYRLDAQGGSILVPEASVHETRLSLAGAGLPRGGGVGFEVFDEPRFGESEFAEQVKYHRALEGELARTIGALGGVENARVHIVLPERTLFATETSKASASVVLTLRRGGALRDEQVRGIVHLVAASVRGLQAEDITIVDGEGRPLTQAGGELGGGDLATRALAFRHDVEQSREAALQQLLDRTLGEGVAVVRVAAEVSFAREERTEERYDPQTIATRSFQLVTEGNGADGVTVGGIPGTPSNLPGGEAPQTGAAGVEGAGRRSETRNFEVSHTTTHAIEPAGRVTTMHVAVVVDGRWNGTGAQRRFTARPAEELARIRGIVSNAAGLSETRGDSISVECVAFAARPVAAREAVAAAGLRVPWWTWLAVGGGALVLVLGMMATLVRRSRRKKAEQEKEKEKALEPVKVSAILGPAHAPPDPAVLVAPEMAANDPALAARIVRAWLTEGVTAQ